MKGQALHALTLYDLRSSYVDLVHWVQNEGKPVSVRNMLTYEVTGAVLEFPDGDADFLPVGVGRRVNKKLAAIEALSLLAGRASEHLILRAAPEYTRVLVTPDDLAYGAYGPRTVTQLPEVVEQLRRDPTTRQAVVSIWSTWDLMHVGDKPCTLSLQFLVRDGFLDMIVTMRSQDVWLGAAYDMFMFTQLRDTIARCLGYRRGRYVHQVGSLHLYDRNVSEVERLHYLDPTDAQALPHGFVIDMSVPSWQRLEEVQHNVCRLLDGFDAIGVRLWNPWYAQEVDRVMTL